VPLNHLALRQGIIDTCLEINRSGLNQGTSGNVSHRIEGGMLITPTSLPYERMAPEDIVEMDWDAAYDGRHRPSSEWRFHRDILRARGDVNVVLHTHSVYCTTLAVHERAIPAFHYMVAVAGGIDVRCAPYACFGTQELSDNALAALEGRTACLLGHHGLIVLADTFAKALWRATEIETLAKMYVHAQAMGEPPVLSLAAMEQVMEQMRRMSYGQAPDLEDAAGAARPRGHGAVPAARRARAVRAPVLQKPTAGGSTPAGAGKKTASAKPGSAKTASPKAASAKTGSTKTASGKTASAKAVSASGAKRMPAAGAKAEAAKASAGPTRTTRTGKSPRRTGRPKP
jgi:L-fuculose-phosphate aldolase